MRTTHILAAISGALLATILVVFLAPQFKQQPIKQQVFTAAERPYVTPELTQNYKNATFRFSVQTPADFKAQTLPVDEGGAHTILLQNEKGEGIQILVTENIGSDKTLTADDVRASIPDLKVTDAQDLDVGNDYKGVAFKSDNQAFGGDSREVWFYFKGNLYQISTYARLDPLLKAMFATWKFY